MRKRVVVVLVSLAALLAASPNARTQSTDPWMGTWKVNLAKSTYKPGPKPTVAGTVKMEPMAGGFKTTIDATNPQGQPTHTETVGKFDGKDNPVKGDPNRDTAALNKIDDYTIEIVNKKDGKVTTRARAVFSRDGKTRTQTTQGTNTQGMKVNNTIVYEK